MILLDYSQIGISNILAFQDRYLNTQSEDEMVNLIRHTILSTILSYKKRFGEAFGSIVICCDDKHYWRKEVFPNYKCRRKENRDKSGLNWKLIFDTLSKIREELIETFPYKIIHVPLAEGDDVIAVLTRYISENNVVRVGLVEEQEPILIVSSDKDFFQLHQLNTELRQWSPIQHKFVTASKNNAEFIEKIVRGDPGDGIPNIRSDDDTFLNKKRQLPITSTRLTEFLEKGIDACQTPEEKRNWIRNVSLIDFNCIPNSVSTGIIQQYLNSNPSSSTAKIYNYLVLNRCKLLLEEAQLF